MSSPLGAAGRRWLPLAVAMLLAACEPTTTPDGPAEPVSVPPARPAFAAKATARLPAAKPAVLDTVRLPGQPDFQVPQLRPERGGEVAARRINQALTRLLLTDQLENQMAAPNATVAIRRAVAAYEAGGQTGLTGAGFTVLLNQAGLLSLALHNEYLGAYPATATRHATFAVGTGRRLSLSDLLADTMTLRRRWHQRINARLLAHRQQLAQEFKGDSDVWATVRDYTGWSDTVRQIRPAFLPRLQEFALTSRGLVLYTRFEFPHAVLNLAPNDEYFFSYAELQPGLRKNELLTQMKQNER